MKVAYVRNPRGVIHPVPEANIADHLRRPGMSRATLEDWLTQEGLTPTPEPVAEQPKAEQKVAAPVRKKREV